MTIYAAAIFSVALTLLRASVEAAVKPKSNMDCENVVFDHTDKELHVRTIVVESMDQADKRQRVLVLVGDNDTSMPCRPGWWLDHTPQGVVQCKNTIGKVPAMNVCDSRNCEANDDDVELGYIRTMLASSFFMPQQHTMSALCIELGCKAKVKRTWAASKSFLEIAPEAQWSPRSHLRRVLVLGLGSSTMASWMRHKLPDTELHVAELLPGVAAAAPCFGLDTAKQDANASSAAGLHVHVGDGRSYLQNEAPDGHFDVIIADAFDRQGSLPPCFRTREFFQLARKKLSPGGAFSFNLINTKLSLRTVKSLALTFENSHIWVGHAPGAEGIQEVVTAFAPGRPVNAAQSGGAVDTAMPAAKAWFGAAQYKTLRPDVLQNIQPFEDATECIGSTRK